jgi:hypothetical protein
MLPRTYFATAAMQHPYQLIQINALRIFHISNKYFLATIFLWNRYFVVFPLKPVFHVSNRYFD